ncbi:MAG TPA: hypothetical protein PKJ84_07230, partial [Anaerolineales bacterium]|nr:hypothetical protein [Anaerolineales bacterium]
LSKIHLKEAFAVFPVSLAIASGVALSVSSVFGAASARFVARTVYAGWDDPARKSLQGLVPDEKRGRISAFMDSYFITTATVIGCIVLIILLTLVSNSIITSALAITIYLSIALVAALLGIIAFIYLRRVYDTSMLNYRLARSKRKSVLDGIEF